VFRFCNTDVGTRSQYIHRRRPADGPQHRRGVPTAAAAGRAHSQLQAFRTVEPLPLLNPSHAPLPPSSPCPSKVCRHVEIDCWESKSSEVTRLSNGCPWLSRERIPTVLHGHTWTTVEKFANVAQAVEQCAFVTSKLPVILSLEMHCTPKCQNKLAKMMAQSFGSAMLTVRLPLLTNVHILGSACTQWENSSDDNTCRVLGSLTTFAQPDEKLHCRRPTWSGASSQRARSRTARRDHPRPAKAGARRHSGAVEVSSCRQRAC
jgi:hypothetical protein